MAHRSNQAVASQEQPAPQGPDDPPPARRLLIGWTTALAALGLSTAGVIGAIWLLRFPIASFFIGAALAERGAEADFRIINLDLNHATLVDLRFGSETQPDVIVPLIDARWEWSGLSPRLSVVRVEAPRVRLRMDASGRVSAGSLDRLRAGPPGRNRPSIPAIDLEITDGEALIEAPFGALTATFESTGRIGADFQADAHIAETTLQRDGHALERGRADLIIASRDNTLAARFTATADGLTWNGATLDQAQLRITARAPLDLARYEAESAWRAGTLRSDQVNADQLSGGVGGEAVAQANTLSPRVWQGQLRINAATFAAYGNGLESARFDARFDGESSNGRARWTLAGDDFAGLAMLAPRATASGELRFDLDGESSAEGGAQLALSQARLNNDAQDTLRAAFPNLADAPIGPTFAQAERALDAAADRFDLTAPLGIVIDDNATHLRIAAPVELRAATGTILRLSPLRNDAPALVIQWPGAALHGAVALELSGGGAPTATLLLDTIDWSPNAPFEADGTLALSNWRSENASIATDELAVAIAITPQGSGRVDLRGPARITGPIGDGEVRDIVASLDVAVTWNPGWRITPNGCVPMRLGGLDAAGLSFANGALSLCPLNGALIAADANNNLSGGFSIRSLALNGRMAGPEAQPARLGAENVVAQFRGRTGDMTVLIEAATPRLQIDMSVERTLAIAMQRATANARVYDGTWRVDGAFESGTLRDPALPGTVTTIAGQWEASPLDSEGPLIQVRSGEAVLIAQEPPEGERLLFNPMRLANVDATVRDGAIEAHGDIVLDNNGRQLAAFTAEHDISEGDGSTRVNAPEVIFDETLQPYDLTERARGLVENVRGPAALIANIAWNSDGVTATGTLSTTGVSFATATMPVVQDVRGSVYFDDLFNLTTPPGQSATIGLLNPGLAVRDGRVSFQLLSEQRVTIEYATFDFAGGVLAMSPTTVRLGEDETRIELTLRDVDAAGLVADLNIPDLAATGRVEGSFPLRLTRQSAFIEGGVLRSQGEGGIISYTGNAGGDATGAAQIAFDALRSFRYDDLVLTLDGDLNGDVVSSIEFSGRNAGEAVDLGDIAPIPGLGAVTVRGVPFDFNVRVSAPFRSLAQTAASITDPGLIINRANGQDEDGGAGSEEQPEAVDLPTPGTR